MAVTASFGRDVYGDIEIRLPAEYWLVGSFVTTELRENEAMVRRCIEYVEAQGAGSTEVFGGNARGIEADDKEVNVYDLAEDEDDIAIPKADFVRLLQDYLRYMQANPRPATS